MRPLAWLVLKDLLRFRSDGRGAVVTVLTPVMLAVLLGALFNPPDLANSVGLAVIDRDQTAQSRALVDAIRADPNLDVADLPEAEALSAVAHGRLPLALVLPAGSGAALTPAAFVGAGGGGAKAELIFDPSRKTEADLVEGLVTRLIFEQSMARVTDPRSLRVLLTQARPLAEPGWLAVIDQSLGLLGPASADDSAAAAPMAIRSPLAFERREAVVDSVQGGYNSYAHTFAGMLCMFLMFFAADAAKELVAERQSGLQTRLRLSAASRHTILAARVLSVTLIALVISAAVYAVGFAAFEVQVLGSWPVFVLVLVAQAFFVGGFSLLLAGAGRTERTIASLGTFAILVMSFLGGAMLPSFLMPPWLRTIGHAMPTAWATDGLAAMTWRGMGASDGLVPASVLLLCGLLCAAVGSRLFRWE
ncbi:MAG: ABC transporter permease [Myxococcota bacterium]